MIRLDAALVQRALCDSRNKAQTLIKEHSVTVNGTIIAKASFKVSQEDNIALLHTRHYISRAAQKLEGFLSEHDVAIKDKIILDVGASTGGFTQILLENGAKKVLALDVGSAQLHPSLKADSRVESIEHQDIRNFKHEPFEFITCDVSFISLHHILDALNRLSTQELIILFKPQFEVGKGVKRDKKGVVKDTKALELAQRRFEDAVKLLEWETLYTAPSRLAGKEGNIETFYHFRKNH